MQRRYYDSSDPAEREPLDSHYPPSPYNEPSGYNQQHQNPYGRPQQSFPSTSPPPSYAPVPNPQLSSHNLANHQQTLDYSYSGPDHHVTPPQPPPHRDADGRYWGTSIGYPSQSPPNITPGADNFGEAASGGVTGLAYSVAERNARESGLEAARSAGLPPPPSHQNGYDPNAARQTRPTYTQNDSYEMTDRSRSATRTDRDSNSSMMGFGGATLPPGRSSPPRTYPGYPVNDPFGDNARLGLPRPLNPDLGVVNPHEIVDDGDEGLEYRRPARTSMLSLHSDRSSSRHGPRNATLAGAAAAGAVGVGAATSSLAASYSNRNSTSGQYDGVYNAQASAAYSTPSASDGKVGNILGEKSEWLSRNDSGKKKWRLAIIIGVSILVIGAIVGGVVGGVISNQNKQPGSAGQSAQDDTERNGDLSISSAEIKQLLNNKNLHKVFPGIDYTPINTQYPDCLHNPPSQNNVTRDIAVLSQLTNRIRLYGTDCNQTEMVLHAIDRLDLKDSMKLWMGVWQDKNTTTNARQLAQMWDILDTYGASSFVGVIVGNEILFREEMTTVQLGSLMTEVRTNLTSRGMSLPVATSDLGDKWTVELAAESDYIMANIHPFFTGNDVKTAAEWTYSFWESNNGPMWKTDIQKNVISEIGWPTQGGKNCPNGLNSTGPCPEAAVAGIPELNTVLEDWVCDALKNGTNYFWFSAFDEPWKAIFNEVGRAWEDQWGLFDVNRNLKNGVNIPDCGGKTI